MATSNSLSHLPAAEARLYSGNYQPLQRRGKGDYRSLLIILQRALFVIAALLLLSIAVWSNWHSENWYAPPPDIIRSEDLNLSVRNARYAGLDAGKLPFSITADEIIQDKAHPDELSMIAPKADILLNDGGWLYMWADTAIIENTGNRFVLNDEVNIHFSEGYELYTQEARLNMRLGIILGDKPVEAQGVDVSFSGQGFRIHNSGRNIALPGPAALQISDNGRKITVQAETVLEWHGAENKYTAEKNVIIGSDNFTINADKLELYYRDDKNNRQRVEVIRAYGSVKLNHADNVIYADQALYDMSRDLVRFSGDDIRMDSQGIVLTADQSIEYHGDKEIAVAHGNAHVQNAEQKSLSADTIRAKISWVDGVKKISYLTAVKNVSVDTGETQISGNDGQYDFTSDKGTICGDLKITRNGTSFGGECAGIDLKDGVSYIDGKADGKADGQASDTRPSDNASDSRVKGTFETE